MSRKQQLEKLGATPGKLALVGGLSVVLMVVVIRQLPDRSADPTDTREPARPIAAVSATKASVAEEKVPTKPPGEPQSTVPPWPEYSLTDALASNPFEAPLWAIEPKEAEAKATTDDEPGALAELQQQGASIVVIGSREKYATVGDYKVSVGDVLEGYRITDITAQGVILNKLD